LAVKQETVSSRQAEGMNQESLVTQLVFQNRPYPRPEALKQSKVLFHTAVVLVRRWWGFTLSLRL